jgi:hypothetical protein
MEKKKTAVEWLLDNLNFEPYDEEEFISNNKIWEQAKQMEKEQIEESFNSSSYFIDGKEYYDDTYGN